MVTGPTGFTGFTGFTGPTGLAGPTGPGGTISPTGGNLTVDTLNVNQNGSVIIGSSITNGTNILFYKAIDGSSLERLEMGYLMPITTAQCLCATALDSGYDGVAVGNLYAFSDGVVYGTTASQVVLGNTSGKLGLAFKDGTSGTITPFIDVNSTTAQAVINNTSAFYTDIGGSQIQQPKIQYGRTRVTGTTGSQMIYMDRAYDSTSYTVQVTIEDSQPAMLSYQISGTDSFEVFWESSNSGDHDINWAAFGL
jgi:hypothetical protein